ITVYRMGALPTVAVHERRVDLVALRSAVTRAIDETNASQLPLGTSAALVAARRLLDLPWPSAIERPVERRLLEVKPAPRGAVAFSAQATFCRVPRPTERSVVSCVERADLHALLVRGAVAATARTRAIRLPNVYPF